MRIAGLVKTSLIDYPGKVAACLFTQGCDLDCFYCHNRRLIPVADGTVPDQALHDFLMRRKGLLDAIVITGGEPSIHPDLADFILSLKRLDYLVKLDTNGQHPEVIQYLTERQLLDYVAVDYKAPASRYQEIGGKEADARKVIRTIQVLSAGKIDYQVRTTVLPQLHKEDLLTMAAELPELPLWVLNPYQIPEIYRQQDEGEIYKDPHTSWFINQIVSDLALVQSKVISGKA